MPHSFTTLVLAAALAACGSSSSAAKTTPDVPASSGASTATSSDPPVAVTQPAEPAEPATPAEPAAPTPAAPQPATPPPAAPRPAAPEVPRPDPKARLLAAETSAWEAARPVLTKHCASCHTRDGKRTSKKKLDHLDLDTYPPKGHHAAKIGAAIRDVLGLSGKRPTMPYGKAGSVKGDELATIKAWIEAWEAAEKASAHAGAGSHH